MRHSQNPFFGYSLVRVFSLAGLRGARPPVEHVSLLVTLHRLRCQISEQLLLERSLRAQMRARIEVERQAEALRVRLAAGRGRTVAAGGQDVPQGMARRLANLTQAGREQAWAQYRGRKRALMEQLLGLVGTGQAYSLRDLAARLGTSHESVRRYLDELGNLGLMPA